MRSVVEIVAAVRSGLTSPEAVLAEHVARYRETHPAINALIQPRHVAAAEEARAVAVAIASGACTGGLAGVPVSVKECFPVSGLLTTLGIPAARHDPDRHTADIVVRLRSAGAVIVGKANVPQAMYLHETDNPVWGRSMHPSHHDRGPGGSSGGDAALVTAGVVPLAVGTDLAGSIRQPAHACGIAGIVPRSDTLGDGGSFDTMPHLRVVRPRAGLLAATTADLRVGLSACGVGVGVSRGVRGLRIGWFDACEPLEPSPAIRRGVRMAIDRLARAGASVAPVSATLWSEAAWLLLAILSADGAADIRALYGATAPMPEVEWLLRLAGIPRWARPPLATVAGLAGRRVEAAALRATGPRSSRGVAALELARAGLRLRIDLLAKDFDAVVCPVSSLPALRHGTAARLVVAASPCLLANLLDLPAGAVPVTSVRPDEETGRTWSRDPVVALARETDVGSRGLPVGVQVVGLSDEPREGENVVLDVMQGIESAP
ncbi:MAG: amidase [Planctomycetia bacterium]